MADTYPLGTWVRIWATFAGVPDTVRLVIRFPSNIASRYTGDQLTKIDGSHYELWIQAMQPGQWLCAWSADGPGVHESWSAAPYAFTVYGDPSLR